jgi:hypothetical protein
MKYTPEQFSKLPKWAQEEIKTLEMRLTELNGKLDEYKGDKETNTYIRDGLSRIPIPNNSSVEFQCGKGKQNKVVVYVNRDGFVDVNTDSRIGQTMVVMPRAANSFFITFANSCHL